MDRWAVSCDFQIVTGPDVMSSNDNSVLENTISAMGSSQNVFFGYKPNEVNENVAAMQNKVDMTYK